MLSLIHEKKLLQIAIALACIVPLTAGLCGMIEGAGMLGRANDNLDSHFRYLSGLLVGIGVGFLTAIPHIERHTMRIRMLTTFVVIGGMGRLAGMLEFGIPSDAMLAALVMELGVTPLLCLWQHRLAARCKMV